MKKSIIRLQEIRINNFKNIEEGKVSLKSYINLKKNINSSYKKKSDILGIYGQNGSGKTALVDIIAFLRSVLLGKPLTEDAQYFITQYRSKCNLGFTFLMEDNEEKLLVYYDIEIKRNVENNEIVISKEVLSYSPLTNEKRRVKTKVIDYNMEDNAIFKPLCRYNELVSGNKELLINIAVAKVLAQESGESFIFNKRSLDIFNRGFRDNKNYVKIINALRHFAEFNLFIIKNYLSKFTVRLENNKNIILEDHVNLFESSKVTEEGYGILKRILEQINTVIRFIIPGLNIDIADYGSELDKKGNKSINVELVSVREDKRIPLRYESNGIKKIISILTALIAMYNYRGVCLVVDELDSGIFEYLLGEILNILEENAKGQFIFTSHNLRALEKLSKGSIVFTTINPKNRYVRLTNVKSNNNLRDFYLRAIYLGGQKEKVYEETNTFEINYAFRKAGKIINEK
ncbi:AAA family ATPase [Clostridium niameyense]|nr:AAA family ATPase [Clostridium niameyense]